MISRQIAYKVWIKDLISSEFVRQNEEWAPNYVLINGKQVSRVNVIANVISKVFSEDNDYAFIDLDDGSGVVRVKAWKEDTQFLDEVKVGDLVLLIGRVREFMGRIYLSPEVVKEVDLNWGKVRRIELEKLYGKIEERRVNEEEIAEKIEEIQIVEPTQSDRQKILTMIEKEDGAGLEELEKIGDVSKIVSELVQEGEIYESKPGFYKVV